MMSKPGGVLPPDPAGSVPEPVQPPVSEALAAELAALEAMLPPVPPTVPPETERSSADGVGGGAEAT